MDAVGDLIGLALELLINGLVGLIVEPTTATGSALRRLGLGAVVAAMIGAACSLPWDGSERAWVVGAVAFGLLVLALGMGWGALERFPLEHGTCFVSSG